MKSKKTGKVAIQLENNIHNQVRDKTQKKTEKIQETRVLRACLKQNILDILINQIKLFTRYNFTLFLKMGRDSAGVATGGGGGLEGATAPPPTSARPTREICAKPMSFFLGGGGSGCGRCRLYQSI